MAGGNSRDSKRFDFSIPDWQKFRSSRPGLAKVSKFTCGVRRDWCGSVQVGSCKMEDGSIERCERGRKIEVLKYEGIG